MGGRMLCGHDQIADECSQCATNAYDTLECIRGRMVEYARLHPSRKTRITNAGRAARDRELLLEEVAKLHERISLLESKNLTPLECLRGRKAAQQKIAKLAQELDDARAMCKQHAGGYPCVCGRLVKPNDGVIRIGFKK